jgi:uncharacterized secreted protein with C-terminal beta-propeller domain
MRGRFQPVSAWYLADEQLPFGALVLIVGIVTILVTPFIIATAGLIAEDINHDEQNYLKKFSSYEELENFIMAPYRNHIYYLDKAGGRPVPLPMLGLASLRWEEAAGFDLGYAFNPVTNDLVEYSTTNIQVWGVDEADIVKTDGKYIYVVSKNRVVIVDAYPAENAKVLSEIEASGQPTELFVNRDKLVILGWAFVEVYDVSDRERPVRTRDVSFNGYYFDSRMIGDYVYIVVNSPAIYYENEKINLPYISSNGNTKTVPATEIYYFDNIPDYSYEFTTIIAINTQKDEEEITSETFLIGATRNIFVSSNNIYITYTNNWYTPRPLATRSIVGNWGMEKTVIHKISIAGGAIEYKSQGEIPGHVLNQFSMDEYQGYFRIATTTREVWDARIWIQPIFSVDRGGPRNHVYVLDEDLNIVGRLEGLAPGERIYSARFMGSRAYLVTFKKIDPLFVIDLRDPRDPKVLGELKIPGYSDYLHPYDENHIIGVGKDTVDMGSFAWYQGVKMALFDVSDPENPREISKYMIGDRGTDSYALSDHKAFLFSRSKNLLVIPILLAEIDEERYPGGVPPNAFGEYIWQGAYVFNVSIDNGFVLKGRITHLENDAWTQGGYTKWSSYTSSNYNYHVKRSLYIDNALYTISDGLVKMNNLEDLNELNKIEL